VPRRDKAMKTLFGLLILILAVGASAQDKVAEPTEYVTQILEPTGGKIARPRDWFYAENHGGPSYMWILSKEDSSNGQPYITGVRIQTLADVKQGTGKSAKEFVLDFATKKKQSADKIVSTCGESKLGLFTRICLETEEGPYRIMYSMFWGTNTDLAVLMTAGTKTELWEKYAPVFKEMSAFELIDGKRFDKGPNAADAPPGPVDAVSVYLVPLDDFPEDLASSLAKLLQQNLNLRVKASLRLPALSLTTLPGTNQYVAEDILSLGAAASASLPETSSTTYRVFLTTRDTNTRSGNFRFQFSAHNKALNCSVVSMARLLEYSNDRPMLTERAATRLLKMTKRAIGEMRLGWSRSADKSDLMYTPIMSLDDLDRLGLEHHAGPGGGQAQAVAPYRMDTITMLQPDAILSQRVSDAQGFADYVTRLNDALAGNLKTYSPAAPAGGYVVVAVRPGGKSKVWLALEPPLPVPLANKLISAAKAVAPFRAKGGNVVFGLKVSLWGGASDGIPPSPSEWRAIVKKRGHALEAGQLVDLAWGKD
jgi:predicted Zn-dependent protease